MVLETFSNRYILDFLVKRKINDHYLQSYCHRKVLQQYFVKAVYMKNIGEASECLKVPMLDVNLGFINGQKSFNAMFYAVQNRDADMVELLMNHKANCFCNGHIDYYYSPFMTAVKKNYFEILEVFLRCYSGNLVGTLNMSSQYRHQTLSEDTLMMGQLSIMEELDTGERVSVKDFVLMGLTVDNVSLFRMLCFLLQKYHRLEMTTYNDFFDFGPRWCMYHRAWEDALFLMLLKCNFEFNTIDFIMKFALKMGKKMDRRLFLKHLSNECADILLSSEKHNLQKFIACAAIGNKECKAFLQKPWKRSRDFRDDYNEFDREPSEDEEEEDEDVSYASNSENNDDNNDENMETEEEAENRRLQIMNEISEERKTFMKCVVLEPFWGEVPQETWFMNHPYIAGYQNPYLRKNGLVENTRGLTLHNMALNSRMLCSLQRVDHYFDYAQLRTWMHLNKWESIEAMCLRPKTHFVVPANLITYKEEVEARNLIPRMLSPEEWKICLQSRDKNVHFIQFFMESFSDHVLHRYALAWAMASHTKRLASASPARDLSIEIFRVIWKHVVESRSPNAGCGWT